jgi:histidinol-phosphate aminotransferase
MLSSPIRWLDTNTVPPRSAKERRWLRSQRMPSGSRPSDANFVLLPVDDAARASDALRARSIFVRAFPVLTGIGDALRISIGTKDVMQFVLQAVLEVT